MPITTTTTLPKMSGQYKSSLIDLETEVVLN